ncbi:MAG: endonuclease III [Rhodospirillaceae bacterium]|nr:endonuclease III [Rhodospirillaceae bacterium]|tara:strand:+ start:3568 stop:4206 length:639 start_codon:yes stop_codon:yes gene_type:complete
MKNKEVEEFFRRLQSTNSNPKTELQYQSNFELLVAVVLSAQATDISVNKATNKLFKVANTPDSILKLGERSLKIHIKTIGLYNSKAKNIMALSKILADQYGGEVPSNRKALESLPGVGRKTANVVLNVLFGVPTIAVDTHIFRLSNRTGLAKGKNPLEVEKNLMRRVPPKYLKEAHNWLILHGRYTCKSRNPKCSECIVRDLCLYKEKIIST